MNVHPPVVSYLKEFCQSLEAEGPASVVPFTSVETYIEFFCQTLEPEGDSLTLTDLDSGDIHAMDQNVWDKDVDQWLNDLMAMLEDPFLFGRHLGCARLVGGHVPRRLGTCDR